MGAPKKLSMHFGTAPPMEPLKPKAERANEGSKELTDWCPKCEERALPDANDRCMFCSTQLEGNPRPTVPTDEVGARIVSMLQAHPRQRGEIDREFPRLSAVEVSKALNVLLDEGYVTRIGNRGGARYALPTYTEPEEAPLPEVQLRPSTDHISVPSPGFLPPPGALPATTLGGHDFTVDQQQTQPWEGVYVNDQKVADSAEEPAVARRSVEEIVEELSEALSVEVDGTTMLRARYLAVLLRKLEEPGPPNPDLMDRFERLAGLSA
jgi:hypothetical protein